MMSDKNINYKMGHSASTISSHASRTVQSDAAFLLPHIKPTDKILDVGCGPGTITVGFLQHVPGGSVTGTDYTEDILDKARQVANEQSPEELSSNKIQFVLGNVLERLPFEDNTFDIVFSSQLFPHLPPPNTPVTALKEMRRVVKPGGIVATRDGAAMHWYPLTEGLKLWAKYLIKAVESDDLPGAKMGGYYRKAGFDVEGGKVKIGAGATCVADAERREWWKNGLCGRLKEGDPYRASWVKAGATDEEIEIVKKDLDEWAKTQDAWYAVLQSEVIATK